MEKPRLRKDIQPIPVMHEGRRVIAFFDPLRLAEGNIAVDMRLYVLLEKLDGLHGPRELQEILEGVGLRGTFSLADIEVLLLRLDEHFLLDSERFRARQRDLREAFRREPDRHSVHAGRAYSNDPDRLRQVICEIEKELPPLRESSVTGLLAPHIDMGVARNAYVDLYRRLEGKRYDRVIVLGINHQEQDGLYSLCDKGFLTPFGRIAPDEASIAELKRRLPAGALASDDFGHKMEHSIEFQALFLHHYLEPPFRMVPILCGSLHKAAEDGGDILQDQRFQAILRALEDIAGDKDGTTLLVAGVDFSHVGYKFGHGEPASAMLPAALEGDQTILSLIEKGDAAGICRHARDGGDRFNVCGLPAIILFTLLMRNSRGRLLSHEVYREDATESAVTYASMLFEKIC